MSLFSSVFGNDCPYVLLSEKKTQINGFDYLCRKGKSN